MVHQAVALIDTLSLQDIRADEKDLAGWVYDLAGIGGQLVFGQITASQEQQKREHKTDDCRPFELLKGHGTPPYFRVKSKRCGCSSNVARELTNVASVGSLDSAFDLLVEPVKESHHEAVPFLRHSSPRFRQHPVLDFLQFHHEFPVGGVFF